VPTRFLTSSKRSSGKAGGNVRREGWGCPDIDRILKSVIKDVITLSGGG
jgi:hypothetical protein